MRKPRHNNTPPSATEPFPTGGHGAEHAPTRKATEQEAARHREEEAAGHFAAGVAGRIKAVDKAPPATARKVAAKARGAPKRSG